MKTFKPERYWVVLAVLCLAGCSDDTPLTFGCPNNGLRIESGKCGCDWPHPEKDDDKYWDESENRCIEPTSVCPGNVAAIDTDGDGTPDCLDKCPDDPDKTSEGVCGCNWHYPEEFDNHDYDNDGVLDCRDNKHNGNDGGKTEPGVCGFGMKDTDTDEDGTPDCLDKCPDAPNKIDPGVCGCYELDIDDDNDGYIFCGEDHPKTQDRCPEDPDKIEPGVCGCSKPDIDSDNDGILDCNDPYPYSKCTDASPFFDEAENLYCIKEAKDFYLLHQQQPNLEGAKIHLLKDINLGDLDEFILYRGELVGSYYCNFTFSKPEDPSKPDGKRIIPDSFLPDLTRGAEFISADDEPKKINLHRGGVPCPLPYPLFDRIEDSTVQRIVLALDINGESTIDNSKATASLAHRTHNAIIEYVNFCGKLTTTFEAMDVGGLVGTASQTTFRNIGTFFANIKAPHASHVGGFIGRTDDNSSATHPTSVSNTLTLTEEIDEDYIVFMHLLMSIEGQRYVGGVIGFMGNGASVSNIRTYTGSLLSTASDAYVGGIAGAASAHNKIWDIINISESLKGDTVGGLIGKLPEPIEIQNIYNQVSSISGNTAGGLFGEAKVGFDLNTVSNTVEKLEGHDIGAIVGKMTISSPHTWTNVTSIAKVTSTNIQKGGLIANEVVMTGDAKLTFQNTVIGGISNNASYPLIASETLTSASCNKDNTCFEGTNAYYFYKTKPTGSLDQNAKLDSVFTSVDAIAKSDSDKTSMITNIIEILNGAFQMDSSWKAEGVTLADETDEFMFPIFRDYIAYVKDMFEDPEDTSGEE